MVSIHKDSWLKDKVYDLVAWNSNGVARSVQLRSVQLFLFLGVRDVRCRESNLWRLLTPEGLGSWSRGGKFIKYVGLLAEVNSGYTKWGELENSPVKQQASTVGLLFGFIGVD